VPDGAWRASQALRSPIHILCTLTMRSLRPPLGLGLLLTGCGSPPTAGPGGGSDLGPNASLQGWRPFPDDNDWNTPVDQEPVDPNSTILIASIGAAKGLHPDFDAAGLPILPGLATSRFRELPVARRF